jgi:hypothetical protein
MKNQFIKPGLLLIGALFLFASFVYLTNEEPATSAGKSETTELQSLITSQYSPARERSMDSKAKGQEEQDREILTCATICDNLLEYGNYYCSSPFRPALCLCDKRFNPPAEFNAIILCQSLEIGARSTAEAPRKVDIAKLIDKPIIALEKPYEGSPGCTVSAGKLPLVLNPTGQRVKKKSVEADRGAVPDKNTKRKTSAVKLCKKDCEKVVQWAFEPVDEEDLLQGHYIRLTGQKEQYLSYDKDNGLTLVNKKDKMTIPEEKAMTWHVGAGQIDEEEAITGYRIISSFDFTKGLVVDKKSGAVAVEQIFTPVIEDGNMKGYELAPDYESVWTFSNCAK